MDRLVLDPDAEPAEQLRGDTWPGRPFSQKNPNFSCFEGGFQPAIKRSAICDRLRFFLWLLVPKARLP